MTKLHREHVVVLASFEKEDGTPAEPPTLRSSVLAWRPGDTTIPSAPIRALRVVEVRSGRRRVKT
jgi:hypothetical protein